MPKSATQYGCSLIALAFVFLAAPLPAQEATPGKQPSPTPAKADQNASGKKDGDAKSSADDGQTDALGSLSPNHPVKGLKFPTYDDDGKLQMMLMADVATKVDPTHIELQNMKIDATGDDGKNFHVELPSSVFEVPTRVLTGDKGVLIKREDFVLTGDAGEFYLKTRFAKVMNNVKMIIFTLPAPSPTPKSTTSPTSKTEKPAKS